LLAWIDAKIEKIDNVEGQIRCFSDIAVLNRGPESVYFEILQHKMNSPRRCKTCGALSMNPKTGKSVLGDPPYAPGCCPKCGAKPNSMCLGQGIGTMDEHMDSALTKEQVMGEMIQAAEKAANFGRGYVPAGIEAALAELKAPTLSPHDIIVNAMQRRMVDVGGNNDFTRYRRRPQFLYEKNEKGEYKPVHRIYTPRKYDFTPRWLVLLDTSGSMSDQDICTGMSEIQIVAGMQDSEGWLVCWDAKAYWDQKQKITCTTDIKRSRIVGRGGTVVSELMSEIPEKMGVEFDLICLVTDGDCGASEVKVSSRIPGVDYLWLVVNMRDFKAPYGRCINLHPARN
jgi:hypothetical protein